MTASTGVLLNAHLTDESKFWLGFSSVSFYGVGFRCPNTFQKAELCHPDWARSKHHGAPSSCMTTLFATPPLAYGPSAGT